jgi:dehydrogenase/reductase SDR family member 1
VTEGSGAIPLPGTVKGTPAEVTALGGTGVALPCDHRDDAQVAAVFEAIGSRSGRLDILVNNAWGGYEHFWVGTEFWNEHGFWTVPVARWDAMFAAGVPYGVAKAATDRMAVCMAHELREHGVAAVSLYPGLVRTESVPRAAEHFDLSRSESPRFVGRVVVALAADPAVIEQSGKVLTTAGFASAYGIEDPEAMP